MAKKHAKRFKAHKMRSHWDRKIKAEEYRQRSHLADLGQGANEVAMTLRMKPPTG